MMHYVSDSHGVVPRPATSAFSWELTGNVNSWLHPRPIQSEVLKWTSVISVLTIPSGNADATWVLKIIMIWVQHLFPLPASLFKVASILTSSLPDTDMPSSSTVAFTYSKTWSLNSHLSVLHRCHSVFSLCLWYSVANNTFPSADEKALLILSVNNLLIYPFGPLALIPNRHQ